MAQFPLNDSSLPIETVTVYRPSGTRVIRRLDGGLKVSTLKLSEVQSMFSCSRPYR